MLAAADTVNDSGAVPVLGVAESQFPTPDAATVTPSVPPPELLIVNVCDAGLAPTAEMKDNAVGDAAIIAGAVTVRITDIVCGVLVAPVETT